MASLSKHGTEIGRIDFVSSSRSYRSDGQILNNTGWGWKLWRKVNDGVDPVAHFNKVNADHEALLADRPALAAYRKELIAIAHSKRALLHQVIQASYTDPDGVWADACDGFDRIDATLDEIVELCRLYQLYRAEKVIKAANA